MVIASSDSLSVAPSSVPASETDYSDGRLASSIPSSAYARPVGGCVRVCVCQPRVRGRVGHTSTQASNGFCSSEAPMTARSSRPVGGCVRVCVCQPRVHGRVGHTSTQASNVFCSSEASNTPTLAPTALHTALAQLTSDLKATAAMTKPRPTPLRIAPSVSSGVLVRSTDTKLRNENRGTNAEIAISSK